MSTGEEPVSQAASETGQARMRYSRDELLALKDHHDCQKLPAGLEPDDLSDLLESVFFDKNSMFDNASGDIYLGPQRGPPPGLRPAFAGPRRTGFAPGQPLHSRLVDDGRSLSPERGGAGGGGFNRMPSSNLTSAFATSPHKAPLAGVRARFDDASRMDRWDSNKQPGASGGAGEEDWTPRGRGGRAGDWRGGDRGGEPGTPGTAQLGTSRHSLDRAGSGWGGREGGGEGGVRRAGSGVPKEAGGRWAKDDHDDWRARKQAGALPEPRYDWADRNGAAAAGPQREPPPGFGGPGGRRGMPEWADDGSDAHRGPVTAADIEAERQRMQKQWKAQREAAGRGGGHEEGGGEHHPSHHGGREEEGGPNTFLAEVMGDDDFDAWAREEMRHQKDEEKMEEEHQQRAAAAPKPGQQIDVKALFGGTPAAPSAAAAPAPAPAAAAAPGPAEQQKAGEGGEAGVRSRFANFFKLDEGAGPAPAAAAAAAALAAAAAGAGAPSAQEPSQQAPLPPHLAAAAAAAGEAGITDANAGRMLLAMLKKQLPGGGAPAAGPLPAAAQLQLPQQPAMPAVRAPVADSGGADLDDVAQVAMSAALQGLDEELVEEGLRKQQQEHQAGPAQQQQRQVSTPPPHLQAQQAQQHAAMLAALGIRPMQPQQAQQQGLSPQQAAAGLLRGPGGLPQQAASPAGAGPVGFPPGGVQQYQQLQAMQQQYGGMPQAPRPQFAQPPPSYQQQPPQYGGLHGYQQQPLPQYRPPMGAPGVPHVALLQQQAQQAQQAQQNALLAQLLAAQQRQQQQAAAAAQAQQLMQQQAQQQQGGAQQGQINLAALLAAAQGRSVGAGVGMSSIPQQGVNAAQLMGQPRVPGMMQPNLGQMQQPSAQLQLLQQLQMAAAAGQGGGGGGMPGGTAGLAHQMQPGGQPGGLTAQQQQQLLGMLRAQQRQ